MKSSMTSIRVIYVHRERAKVDFKSREVNCLKECALALRPIYTPDSKSIYPRMTEKSLETQVEGVMNGGHTNRQTNRYAYVINNHNKAVTDRLARQIMVM